MHYAIRKERDMFAGFNLEINEHFFDSQEKTFSYLKKYMYTVKKNMKVYKTASKKSKNKFTLKKGDKLRIIKIKPAKNGRCLEQPGR